MTINKADAIIEEANRIHENIEFDKCRRNARRTDDYNDGWSAACDSCHKRFRCFTAEKPLADLGDILFTEMDFSQMELRVVKWAETAKSQGTCMVCAVQKTKTKNFVSPVTSDSFATPPNIRPP